MSRRLIALSTIPLAAAFFAAGCSQPATPAAAPSAPSSAPAASSAAPSPSATASRGGRGGGDFVRLVDAEHGPKWLSIVLPCKFDLKPELQNVFHADVNGDGVDDSLVLRSCQPLTSYWPSTVEVFDGTSPASKPRRIGTMLTGVIAKDGPWVYDLKVTNGVVTMKAHGLGPVTDLACPDETYTYRYQLSGGTFRLLDRKIGPKFDGCPQIGS